MSDRSRRCRLGDATVAAKFFGQVPWLGTLPDEYGARAEETLRDALAGRRPPGTGIVSGTTTLGDLLTRYIERCRRDGELAPKSVDTYAATLN